MTIHPFLVRLTHWINALCMLGMVMSGWGIYDASPLFPFRFPHYMTLGGWLGGNIAWHLAVAWVLVVNGALYFTYSLVSRRWARTLLPLRPSEVGRDLRAALQGTLRHRPGVYNAVQRLLYMLVLLAGVGIVASGLAIWKPVQLAPLTDAMGGYEVARRVHFLAMASICLFTAVHLVLVALVPRTLPPMITGRAPAGHAPVAR